MRKLLLFMLIIAVKILVAKGVALLSILLAFAVKGTAFKKSEQKWNAYFLSQDENSIFRKLASIYGVSVVLSACLMFLLFRIFSFRYPLFLTLAVSAVCIFFSWRKYRSGGKQNLLEKFEELKSKIIKS